MYIHATVAWNTQGLLKGDELYELTCAKCASSSSSSSTSTRRTSGSGGLGKPVFRHAVQVCAMVYVTLQSPLISLSVCVCLSPSLYIYLTI